ncbi:MAG TPA: hypothetical protein GXX51_00235 [Firmicutes bacterium]|nr:hypothetical protein [Bacillota bacterium]
MLNMAGCRPFIAYLFGLFALIQEHVIFTILTREVGKYFPPDVFDLV